MAVAWERGSSSAMIVGGAFWRVARGRRVLPAHSHGPHRSRCDGQIARKPRRKRKGYCQGFRLNMTALPTRSRPSFRVVLCTYEVHTNDVGLTLQRMYAVRTSSTA